MLCFSADGNGQLLESYPLQISVIFPERLKGPERRRAIGGAVIAIPAIMSFKTSMTPTI